jgi:group II intron reverse transcriptase/maturase
LGTSAKDGNEQQPPQAPTKQQVRAARWAAVDWPELEAKVFRISRLIHLATKQGNMSKVHRLQQMVVRSFSAKLLAVRLATEDAKGKDTPGVDGIARLSDAKKWETAESLHIASKPSALRRVKVPKPGKKELRPLGIPVINDRALQHLIKLAVEPAAEAILAPEQFGFRRGRGCQDAIDHLRLRLKKPAHVLDADIEKFFDSADHEAILAAVPAPPLIKKAIRRLLKAEIWEGSVIIDPLEGTPQGGPLSPLLANLLLAGLPAEIRKAFPPGHRINGRKIGKIPYTLLYADDFVVIHPDKEVIEAVKVFIEEWLTSRGLRLQQEKTKIRHTAEKANDGTRGFDFLGFTIRHHPLLKTVGPGKTRGYFLWIGPSKKALAKARVKCAEIVKAAGRSKKRRGSIEYKAKEKGQPRPVETMVIRLNHFIRGWTGYYRHSNAKLTFNALDHWLFWKIWKWVARQHPNQRVAWRKQRYYSTVGNRSWRFKVESAKDGQPLHLDLAAYVPITSKTPYIKAGKSWFDGDWAYWSKRTGKYPMLNQSDAGRMKRQKGKCPHCGCPILSSDDVLSVLFPSKGARQRVICHRQCAVCLPDPGAASPFAGSSFGLQPGAVKVARRV